MNEYEEFVYDINECKNKINETTNLLNKYKNELEIIKNRYPVNSEFRNKLYEENIINAYNDGYSLALCGHYCRLKMSGYYPCNICGKTWINRVKEYQLAKRITYKQALIDLKAHKND